MKTLFEQTKDAIFELPLAQEEITRVMFCYLRERLDLQVHRYLTLDKGFCIHSTDVKKKMARKFRGHLREMYGELVESNVGQILAANRRIDEMIRERIKANNE